MRMFSLGLSLSVGALLVIAPMLGMAHRLSRRSSCTKTIRQQTVEPEGQVMSLGGGNSDNQATKGRQDQVDDQPFQSPQDVAVVLTT